MEVLKATENDIEIIDNNIWVSITKDMVTVDIPCVFRIKTKTQRKETHEWAYILNDALERIRLFLKKEHEGIYKDLMLLDRLNDELMMSFTFVYPEDCKTNDIADNDNHYLKEVIDSFVWKFITTDNGLHLGLTSRSVKQGDKVHTVIQIYPFTNEYICLPDIHNNYSNNY